MNKSLLSLAVALLAVSSVSAADRSHKLIIIAGKPSHPPGMHEFRAGSLLLQRCLANVKGLTVEVHTNGWVSDDKAFEGADAVFIYADGGGGHPAIKGDHLEVLKGLVKKGVGIGFGHYGVEIPKDNGGPEYQ